MGWGLEEAPFIKYFNVLLLLGGGGGSVLFYLLCMYNIAKSSHIILQDCGFKCTTVNGMKYHFVRCLKSDPPEFACAVCKKKFQCRTGLVWHLKKHHDVHMYSEIAPEAKNSALFVDTNNL